MEVLPEGTLSSRPPIDFFFCSVLGLNTIIFFFFFHLSFVLFLLFFFSWRRTSFSGTKTKVHALLRRLPSPDTVPDLGGGSTPTGAPPPPMAPFPCCPVQETKAAEAIEVLNAKLKDHKTRQRQPWADPFVRIPEIFLQETSVCLNFFKNAQANSKFMRFRGRPPNVKGKLNIGHEVRCEIGIKKPRRVYPPHILYGFLLLHGSRAHNAWHCAECPQGRTGGHFWQVSLGGGHNWLGSEGLGTPTGGWFFSGKKAPPPPPGSPSDCPVGVQSVFLSRPPPLRGPHRRPMAGPPTRSAKP